MHEAARPAVASDRVELVRLAALAIEELRPHRGGEVWYRTLGRAEPLGDGFDADFADETTSVVVGTIDDVVVGYGVMRIETLRDESKLAVVSDLFTQPEARAVGVGEAMMDLLVDDATTAGCFGIETVALPGDRETKNFFETFGLVARALQVHRSLEP